MKPLASKNSRKVWQTVVAQSESHEQPTATEKGNMKTDALLPTLIHTLQPLLYLMLSNMVDLKG
jgi:hypothetical protein